VLTRHQNIAASILRQRFGSNEIVAHETWGASVVVEMKTATGGVFLKANGDRSVRAEARVAGIVRDAGVPAPVVVEQGVDERLPGGRWILMERVPGENWDHQNAAPDSLAETFRGLASNLHRLHAIRLQGYGWIDDDGRGTSKSWTDWVRDEVAKSAGMLDAQLPKGFAELADRIVSEVIGETAPALLNADLNLSEIFVDPATGKVTGILDWAAAAIGDPLLDLATFAFGGPAGDPIPPKLQPLLIEAYQPTNADERAIAVYQLLNHLWNGCWSVTNGVDSWIPGLCAEAARLLEQTRRL
jgi:aminoglycoside phosphotransferase (APT) family kinase protein